jgi:hypothetical protein
MDFSSPSERLKAHRLFVRPCGHDLPPSLHSWVPLTFTPLLTSPCESTPERRKRHSSASRCQTTSRVPSSWFHTTTTVYSYTRVADIAACCQPGFAFPLPCLLPTEVDCVHSCGSTRTREDKSGCRSRPRASPSYRFQGRRCGCSLARRPNMLLIDASLPREGCN